MNLTTTRMFVGQSAWTSTTHDRIAQAAPFRANVLVAGPSGTGKELIARALHTTGPRADGPFVPMNCAAIPHSLFDSQMFGHLKGAFTGAEHASLGNFRAAEGGTLFLDEIGELDLDLQAKLLRVLQDREVTPVGSHAPVPIDVRIVAATNRDLQQEVAEGRFRLDLYYRLNVIEIPTLPLRQRQADIEPLARHMLHKACVENGMPPKQLNDSALDALRTHHWPGNVRELQNLMERVALATRTDQVGRAAIEALWNRSESSTVDEVPRSTPVPQVSAPSPTVSPASHWKSLEDVEAEHIQKSLEQVFYNQSAAARLLKIDRKRLARKMDKYGLRPAATRSLQS